MDLSQTDGRRLIDALHRNKRAVNDACIMVRDIADALSRVGLNELAAELEDAIAQLPRAAAESLTAWNADMDRQMSHGQEMLGGILKLGLKMAEQEK